MTNITQTPDSYPEGVYQLAVTDPVLGGPEGFSNKAAIDLANRTAYQRMRNVTPWRSGLENPYPAHAYVHHAGVTWKSLVANANVEPGTDATKWIRWGYTSAELADFMLGYLPYAAPLACPNTGPIGTDNKAKLYKSALGEYWMWMGDLWQVVAGHYGVDVANNNYSMTGNVQQVFQTFTAPRAGVISCGISSFTSAAQAGNTLFVQGRYNATQIICADSTFADITGRQQYVSASQSMFIPAGTVITLEILSQNTLASGNARSHVRYLN